MDRKKDARKDIAKDWLLSMLSQSSSIYLNIQASYMMNGTALKKLLLRYDVRPSRD